MLRDFVHTPGDMYEKVARAVFFGQIKFKFYTAEPIFARAVSELFFSGHLPVI
jgi:hypothetical protein